MRKREARYNEKGSSDGKVFSEPEYRQMMFENEISVPEHRDLFFYENTADIYAAEDRKSRGSTVPGQVRAAGCGMSGEKEDLLWKPE